MKPILWCHKHGYEDMDQCPKCQEARLGTTECRSDRGFLLRTP